MQGKKEMIDHILKSAKDAAARKISEATEETDSHVEEVRTEIDAQNKKADEAALAAADALYDSQIKLAELDAQKIALKAKRECVDAVYDELKRLVYAMPDKAYLALLQERITNACSDGDEVIAAEGDKRITAEWISKVSKAAKKKLTLSKKRGDFKAGVILRNEMFDIDLTIDEIIAEFRESTVSETAKKLGL